MLLQLNGFFFAVQNKMHFAIHGYPAAEVILDRASAEKEHMGLTIWKNAPQGKIVKSDVSIRKNYLEKEEVENLILIVTIHLDYAEFQAKRNIPMTILDWEERLNTFYSLTIKTFCKGMEVLRQK